MAFRQSHPLLLLLPSIYACECSSAAGLRRGLSLAEILTWERPRRRPAATFTKKAFLARRKMRDDSWCLCSLLIGDSRGQQEPGRYLRRGRDQARLLRIHFPAIVFQH